MNIVRRILTSYWGSALLVLGAGLLVVKACSVINARKLEPLGVGDLVIPATKVIAMDEQSFSVDGGEPAVIKGRSKVYPVSRNVWRGAVYEGQRHGSR